MTKLKILILSISVFLFVNSILTAQTTALFNYLEEVTLTTEEQVSLANWEANPLNAEIDFVSVNEISGIESGGSILVNLPNLSNLTMNTNSVVHDDEGGYHWSGNFQNGEGNALFYYDGNRTFGYINHNDDTYSIKEIGGHSVLIKHDDSSMSIHECATPEGGEPLLKGPPTPKVSCIITVLVLYTNAANSAGNPQSDAALFIANTNQALENSAADHRVKLVGVRPFTAFIETPSHADDLDFLRTSPYANDLRDQYNADLVVALTDGNYTGNFGGFIYGRAYVNEAGDSDYGFCISEIDAPSGRHTFAHELMHDLGARHDTDSTPGFAHAHSFTTGTGQNMQTRRTILAAASLNESRELNFSNPAVSFIGVPTGIVNTNDNVRQINALGCIVSQYKIGRVSSCIDFNALILGPTDGSGDEMLTWCANSSGCEGNVSYQWEYSYNGFSWSDIPNSNNMCQPFVMPTDNDLHLRVTVTCISNGCRTTDTHLVINDGDGGENPFGGGNNQKVIDKNNNTNGAFKVFPNPTSGEINIVFTGLIEEGKDIGFKYRIFDNGGKEIMNGHANVSDSINLSKIPSGHYIISVQTKNSTFHEKFSILH